MLQKTKTIKIRGQLILSVKKASEQFSCLGTFKAFFKPLKHVAGHALKKIVYRSVAYINIRRKIDVDTG